jgi:hypothetical protein
MRSGIMAKIGARLMVFRELDSTQDGEDNTDSYAPDPRNHRFFCRPSGYLSLRSAGMLLHEFITPK